MLLKSFIAVGTTRPEFEVADIFRHFGEEYRDKYPLSWQQLKVMQDIINCRTATLGGYIEMCDTCGKLRVSYGSCQNRHCPKCGAFEKAEWLAAQEVLMLPITYYHGVFTTDHAINPLLPANEQQIYDLLFKTATATLREYGRKYLGGEIGITAVLHTWAQDLSQHIHLHCIITGGAL